MPLSLYATKDLAEGQLNSGINAGSTSIVLNAGEGAEFPQPYTGSASSTGSATTLNDTGDLGSLAVGDFIRNVTDGSCAWVTVAGTNSVTTTRLRGGTLNVWTSGDVWQVNEFIVTIETRDASTPPNVTAREKVLISNRSTDTLTARTRGYDGSTAQSFSADAYVNLHVVSNQIEHMIDVLYTMAVRENTNQTDIATNLASITAIESNATFGATSGGSSNAYTLALTLPAAYTALERVYMKANHTNTGASTLDRNSLGSKNIKYYSTTGIADVAADMIQSGGIYELLYDGTQYILLNPSRSAALGATVTVEHRHLKTSNTTTTSTSFADIDGTNFTDDVTCTSTTILILTLTGSVSHDTTGTQMSFDFSLDGTRLGGTEGLMRIESSPTNSAFRKGLNLSHTLIPGADTWTIRPMWLTAAGTATLYGNPTAVFTIVKIQP